MDSIGNKEPDEKGFFRKAGETIGSIGHELVEGKASLFAASHDIVSKITDQADKILKKAHFKGKQKESGVKAKKSAIAVIRKVSKKAAEIKVAKTHHVKN